MNVPDPRGRHLTEAGFSLQQGTGWLARIFAGGRDSLIRRFDAGIDTGSLEAMLPDGTVVVLGGRAPGFQARLTIRDWRAVLRLMTGGSVGWYRAWVAGEWESDDPVTLFALFISNGERLARLGRAKGPWRAASRIIHRLRRNTRAGSRENIAAHYDLGNDFYAAWLDPTLSYSSGLFTDGCSLQAAQLAKVEAMAARLNLHRGDRVLEIGCGWGFLARHLAAACGAQVTAISLSDEQLAHARERAQEQAVSVDFRKQDYRDVEKQFDAIVSVEMVEALGREYWPAFLDCIARALRPGGRAAIQFISMREELFDGYAANADFIQTYIFPGGLLIRNSEFRQLAESRGLIWEDRRDFGLDYAETLRIWRAQFDAAIDEGRLPPGFDRQFNDLWRYYLMYCEGGFRGDGLDVHQVTLRKP